MSSNKPQLQLIPPIAKELEAASLAGNAAKHGGQWNWREGGEKSIPLMEYLGKIQRHVDAIARGEWHDEEGHSHLGAIRADAGIIADSQLHETLIDDRPKGKKT